MKIDLVRDLQFFEEIRQHFVRHDCHSFVNCPPMNVETYWRLSNLVSSLTDEQKINLVQASTSNVNYFMFVFCLPSVVYDLVETAEWDLGDALVKIFALYSTHVKSQNFDHGNYYADVQRLASKSR